MKAKEKSSCGNPVWAGFTTGAAEVAKQRRVWLDANKPPPDPPSRYFDPNPRAAADYPLHVFTWNYVEANPAIHPTPDKTWRDYAGEAGRARAMEGLRHLQSLDFKNDQDALEAIADIAISATETLSDLSSRTPESVRPVARRRFFWPFLKAKKERFGDRQKHLVKEIELGAEAPPFSEAAVARVPTDNIPVRTMLMLLCRLESYRHRNPAVERLVSAPLPKWKDEAMRLEPFSADTWHDWFEVAWQAVKDDYDGHPERDTALRKIGQHRADHSYKTGAQQKTTPQTREANIKDGIRESLRLATKRLA